MRGSRKSFLSERKKSAFLSQFAPLFGSVSQPVSCISLVAQEDVCSKYKGRLTSEGFSDAKISLCPSAVPRIC